MKVLFITPDFPPVLNSASRLFFELAEDLSHSGHRVTVLTRIPPQFSSAQGKRLRPRLVLQETLGDIQVNRVRDLPVPRRLPLARASEQFCLALTLLIVGLGLPRQDAAIVYSPPLPLGLTGYLLAQWWRGVVIINLQDLYPQTAVDLGLLRNPVLVRLAQTLERFLYRKADAITVHSEGNRDYVLGKGASSSNAHVVPNWVDMESIRPGPRQNDWRRAHGLEKAFIVSFAGTMGFAQGLDDVVRLAERLRQNREIVFVLAGDGVFRDSLQRDALEKELETIRFLPPQSGEAYLQLLQGSDVCLVALRRDLKTPVVPGKLQSIMAAGRPAICWANAASDVRRIVEEAGCGFFVPDGDLAGLEESLLTLYNRRELGESMGQRGRRYAERHFDRKRCTQIYASLLKELKATKE